ncbi:Uncharacterised protein [Yersinia bercovieri]|nr:Uncharacterised protein [Yersinia bercovieri]
MGWFSIAPAGDVGVCCCPVSCSTLRSSRNEIAISGENMAAIGQCRGVNQQIFAGFNQTGNVEHLSGRQVIAAIV